ncbi:hypothetical protein GXM_07476 [Nostoc sphaeroides CCNUC1]|uniref:Uncharacterized protein n=1 Tax=Nostoc sphaeroides CCNUC1 TaxID=2653204 RepID=A0A5P8WBL7_9NOSO|nr:hypothetical protein GXM_07476 [Nostoc sphaeroides CCNUC1]
MGCSLEKKEFELAYFVAISKLLKPYRDLVVLLFTLDICIKK